MHAQQAKAREASDQAVRVTPLTGIVPPYGVTRLSVTFQPPVTQRQRGFAGQGLEEGEAARAFDYVVQVRLLSSCLCTALSAVELLSASFQSVTTSVHKPPINTHRSTCLAPRRRARCASPYAAARSRRACCLSRACCSPHHTSTQSTLID